MSDLACLLQYTSLESYHLKKLQLLIQMWPGKHIYFNIQ